MTICSGNEMERKPLTHDEHLDIIYIKALALANNTFIGKNYNNFGGIK